MNYEFSSKGLVVLKIKACILVVTLLFTMLYIPSGVSAETYADVPFIKLEGTGSAASVPSETMTVTTITGMNLISNGCFEDEVVNTVTSMTDYQDEGSWSVQPEKTTAMVGTSYGRGGERNGARVDSPAANNSGIFYRTTMPGDKHYYFSFWMRKESGEATSRQL